MIPKIIYTVWVGSKPLPNKYWKYMESWKKFNPDYEFDVWVDSDSKNTEFPVFFNKKLVPEEVLNLNYYKQAKEANNYAFMSDVIRAYVMYNFGGIYMDTDCEVVKSFNILLNSYDPIIGYELSGYLAMSTFMGPALHDYYKDVYDSYINDNFNKDYTGPMRYKDIIYAYYGKHDFYIYPVDYFVAYDIFHGVKKTKNTYVIHHFDGSWLSKNDKAKQYVRIKLHKIFGRSGKTNKFGLFIRSIIYKIIDLIY